MVGTEDSPQLSYPDTEFALLMIHIHAVSCWDFVMAPTPWFWCVLCANPWFGCRIVVFKFLIGWSPSNIDASQIALGHCTSFHRPCSSLKTPSPSLSTTSPQSFLLVCPIGVCDVSLWFSGNRTCILSPVQIQRLFYKWFCCWKALGRLSWSEEVQMPRNSCRSARFPPTFASSDTQERLS